MYRLKTGTTANAPPTGLAFPATGGKHVKSRYPPLEFDKARYSLHQKCAIQKYRRPLFELISAVVWQDGWLTHIFSAISLLRHPKGLFSSSKPVCPANPFLLNAATLDVSYGLFKDIYFRYR